MHRARTLNSDSESSQKVWGDLRAICKKIHSALYVKSDRSLARRYLPQLTRMIVQLPENDSAIVRQEGLALFYELDGQTVEAVKHRKKEIELIERLHKDVATHQYSRRTKAFVLADRGPRALQKRRTILRGLQERVEQSQ